MSMKKRKIILILVLCMSVIFQPLSAKADEEEGLELFPYEDVLVGVRSIRTGSSQLTGVQNEKDLEAFCAFIESKKEELLSGGGNIPEGISCITEGPEFRDISRQILAMTAVCRDYTFYNRIVCEWYGENLWNETWTYQIAGTRGQQSAAESALEMAGEAAVCLGGGTLGTGIRALGEILKSHYQDTAVLGKRSSGELYETDSYRFTIPSDWEGWTEENRKECEELLAMGEDIFMETIRQRQEESLLDSPVPFYKQGSVEWGKEPFGNGTLASDACCPTAIAMVLSYFREERITPSEVAARYDQDAYRSREYGSYGEKMCRAAAEDYGLSVEAGTDSLSGSRIREALESGRKIVMSMKPGDGGGRYATVYHYVVLAGLTDDGRVIVNNPGINTDITYDDMETVLNNQSGRGYGIFWKD